MAYRDQVLADSPLGYWRLNEASGTNAADSSGNGNAGTYTGAGVTYSQPGLLLNEGDAAVLFDGVAGDVNLGNPAAFQIGTGTLEAIVQTTTKAPGANFRSIIGKNSAYFMGVDQNGNLVFFDFTTSTARSSGVVITDGLPHHVVLTFQSGVAGGSQLYVDGKAAGSGQLMTVSAQTSSVALGWNSASQFFGGTVDECAIYGTVLSAARITAHYVASRAATRAGFLRDGNSLGLVTGTASPQSMQQGFLRDGNGALVLGTSAPLTMQQGFLRDSNYSLVTIDYASAVAPLVMSGGFLRDANGYAVTIVNASAAQPTAMQQGFVRDANYALVLA